MQYKFNRCTKALQGELGRLPVYGVGHSLGSVMHTLISARYVKVGGVEAGGRAMGGRGRGWGQCGCLVHAAPACPTDHTPPCLGCTWMALLIHYQTQHAPPPQSPQRAGNALMSFNIRPATDVIPFLSPLIAPSARLLGPLLAQLAASPLRPSVEAATDAIKVREWEGWGARGFCRVVAGAGQSLHANAYGCAAAGLHLVHIPLY